MNDAGPNPLAVFVLSAAARELLADGVDPVVVEEVLARVHVDVVPRGAVRAHGLKNQVGKSVACVKNDVAESTS
jgi:hypothetical protein